MTLLYPLFGVNAPDRQALLEAIRQRFSFNEAYSKFGEFMQQHSIQFSASVWYSFYPFPGGAELCEFLLTLSEQD